MTIYMCRLDVSGRHFSIDEIQALKFAAIFRILPSGNINAGGLVVVLLVRREQFHFFFLTRIGTFYRIEGLALNPFS